MEQEKKENQENKPVERKELPSCCQPKKGDGKGKGVGQGILFGLVPHIGCIAFVIASVFGLTVVASVFRPLLMKSYFFYGMIVLSLIFASFSAFLYLRRQGGIKTAKDHKGYLTILYGSTIAISALLYFVVFPLVASATLAGAAVNVPVGTNLNGLQTITVKVGIPCEGHAPLIVDEVKKVAGVAKVEYIPTSTFKVYYDPSKTDKDKILGINIFKDYKATVLSQEE
jgi:copper chaperone CopZ